MNWLKSKLKRPEAAEQQGPSQAEFGATPSGDAARKLFRPWRKTPEQLRSEEAAGLIKDSEQSIRSRLSAAVHEFALAETPPRRREAPAFLQLEVHRVVSQVVSYMRSRADERVAVNGALVSHENQRRKAKKTLRKLQKRIKSLATEVALQPPIGYLVEHRWLGRIGFAAIGLFEGLLWYGPLELMADTLPPMFVFLGALAAATILMFLAHASAPPIARRTAERGERAETIIHRLLVATIVVLFVATVGLGVPARHSGLQLISCGESGTCGATAAGQVTAASNAGPSLDGLRSGGSEARAVRPDSGPVTGAAGPTSHGSGLMDVAFTAPLMLLIAVVTFMAAWSRALAQPRIQARNELKNLRAEEAALTSQIAEYTAARDAAETEGELIDREVATEVFERLEAHDGNMQFAQAHLLSLQLGHDRRQLPLVIPERPTANDLMPYYLLPVFEHEGARRRGSDARASAGPQAPAPEPEPPPVIGYPPPDPPPDPPRDTEDVAPVSDKWTSPGITLDLDIDDPETDF